ncbi:hypothetical protein, partial [Klebsiella pneumoniae]
VSFYTHEPPAARADRRFIFCAQSRNKLFLIMSTNCYSQNILTDQTVFQVDQFRGAVKPRVSP